jgi:uncharacterized iron-regulated protein
MPGTPKALQCLSISLLAAMLLLATGCATQPKHLTITDIPATYPAGTIISTATNKTLSEPELLTDLGAARIVYVGEQHTDPDHHDIQLKIIRALHAENPDLSVGMEMFAHTYQPVLEQWAAGSLTEETFRERTHWYANWRFNYALYKPTLDFCREQHIPLIGLNIPAHLPAKISTGGIDSLLPEEREHLAAEIDLSNEAHRKYIREVFDGHRIPGREKFEYFYMAQCTWEDSMADRIAKTINDAVMVVLLGNGHIREGFGVPQRAFARTKLPYATIYPATVGSQVTSTYADYIWVTPPQTDRPAHR